MPFKKGQKLDPDMVEKRAAKLRGRPGTPWTDEHKRQASESQKGIPKSEATVQRVREACRTPESRERRRQSHVDKPLSQEHKDAITEAMHRPDVVKKISTNVKKAYEDPGMKQRQYDATMANLAKPEVRQRISEGVKKAILTETWQQNHAAAMHDETYRENIRQRRLGVTASGETRRKLREIAPQRALDRWAKTTPEERRAHMQPAQQASMEVLVSSLERQVEKLLIEIGVVYQKQFQIGPYWVDFYLPDFNLAFEVNGCYWHSCPECGYTYEKKRGLDRRRRAYIQACGYQLFILWEHAMDGLTSEQLLRLLPAA